jgi:hypothetical protein
VESERWRKPNRFYRLPLERERGQETAFLKQACDGDESLEREVECLLAQTEGTGAFLEEPAHAYPPPGWPKLSTRWRNVRLDKKLFVGSGLIEVGLPSLTGEQEFQARPYAGNNR